MANSYKGKIAWIEPIQSIARQGKEPFQKRRVLLDASHRDLYTGEISYQKLIMFDFGGKNVNIPDGFQIGEIVEITFDVESRYVQKRDGSADYFTSVNGYKMEKVERKPNAPVASSIPIPPSVGSVQQGGNQHMQGGSNPYQPTGGNAPFPPTQQNNGVQNVQGSDAPF